MTLTAPRTERVFSKDPEILREDLLAGLTVALGDDLPSRITEVDSIVADLASFDDSQEALRAVLRTFGPVVFGAVALHQLDEHTSLMGQAETLTRRDSLAAAGYRVRDLRWSKEILHPNYWEDEDGPLFDEHGVHINLAH